MEVPYESLRTLHACIAVAVVLLLIARLALAASGRNYRDYGMLRWLPHLIDSVLLGTALVLVWRSQQYPFVQPWLTAKVLALPPYIIAAASALDARKNRHVRLAGGVLALLLLTYILAVALTRQVIPW